MASTRRLHSSSMHTARLLTVSPSMYCAGGCLVPGGVCLVGGVPGPGEGAWPGGCVVWGGGCLVREGGGGGGIPACTEADPPL